MAWATLWAIFSQTHLVTLSRTFFWAIFWGDFGRFFRKLIRSLCPAGQCHCQRDSWPSFFEPVFGFKAAEAGLPNFY
jgi:hypothetical protein